MLARGPFVLVRGWESAASFLLLFWRFWSNTTSGEAKHRVEWRTRVVTTHGVIRLAGHRSWQRIVVSGGSVVVCASMSVCPWLLWFDDESEFWQKKRNIRIIIIVDAIIRRM